MRTKAGDIYCERGETFTIGFEVKGNDGAPYVLSSQLEAKHADDADTDVRKAYLLLTVASTANIALPIQPDDDSEDVKRKARYIANFWGDTSRIPKFYTTKPVQNIYTGDNDNAQKAWNSINSELITDAERDKGVNPGNYAIYYKEDSDGTKIYKRLIYDDTTKKYYWTDYKFLYYKYFPKEVTEDWVESQYDYAIKVVAGKVIADAQSEDRPIIVDTSYPILSAHSIYINTNVRGSINAVDGSTNYKEV